MLQKLCCDASISLAKVGLAVSEACCLMCKKVSDQLIGWAWQWAVRIGIRIGRTLFTYFEYQ